MREMYILKHMLFLFTCLTISLQFELSKIISYLFIADAFSDTIIHQSFKACLFKLLFVETLSFPINKYRGEQKGTGTKVFTMCINSDYWF